MTLYKCRSCGSTSSTSICGSCKDLCTILIPDVNSKEKILVQTYKWLLGKFGYKSCIVMDLSRIGYVVIFVGPEPHMEKTPPYLRLPMPDFLQWFEINVLGT